MKKLLAKLLQIRLAVAVIAVLGVAFVAFGFLVGMPPFAYIVIGLLIAVPTVLYVYKPRETALTNAKALTVFFGATVTYSVVEGAPAAYPVTVQIVGVDEVQHDHGQISWISPVAKALLKAHVGDEVRVQTPTGRQTLCIEAVQYI